MYHISIMRNPEGKPLSRGSIQKNLQSNHLLNRNALLVMKPVTDLRVWRT